MANASQESGGALLPGLVLGALLLLGGGIWWVANTHAVPTDPETLCRTDQPPPSISAILIDVTDHLSVGERSQILNEVERLRRVVPRFGEIQVFAIGNDPDPSMTPWLAICNPGRGEDMNAMYQNPDLAEERWRLKFKDRLEEVLSSITAEVSSDQSLIMESIRSVSILSLGDTRFDRSQKELFVFSDFMQNSPGKYSQYSMDVDSFDDFAATPYADSVGSNLMDVTVHMYYIQRPRTARLQSGSHQRFWVNYFDNSGATVASVKRILGD